MIELIIWTGIFILSLAILIKSADYFIESSSSLGLSLGLPKLLIGLTIVAIGTSLPEFLTSLFAVIKSSSEIVISDVIGSNITNIFLVLGVAALFSKNLKVEKKTIMIDLPMLVLSAIALFIAIKDESFSAFEGIIFLIIVLIYLTYSIKNKDNLISDKRKDFKWKYLIIILISSITLYYSSRYTIDAVIHLSKILKIGTDIIAMTAIALGTSLPELMVSISAVRKKESDIAIGNVIGSNIFNTFIVMGVPALITPLRIPHIIMNFVIYYYFLAVGMFVVMSLNRRISRKEGIILFIFYIVYLIKLF
jgi:cation:H+ antiporter